MFRRPVLLLFALLIALSIFCTPARSEDPPQANLVCPTKNRAECYPRIFEATDEFQVIREGQQIPPGLHVRLNIQTGLKEAKLYDGHDQDLENTIEVHQDGPAAGDEDRDVAQGIEAPPADYEPEIPIPPELYQQVLRGGDRTVRRPSNSDADADAFKAAIAAVTDAEAEPSVLLASLGTLEDLAHDIYWGLSLAESGPAIVSIAGLLSSADAEIGSAAALALGNTVHNNPKALNLTLTLIPDLPLLAQDLLFAPPSSASSSPSASTSSSSAAAADRSRCPDPAPHPLPARQYTRLLFLLSSLLSSPSTPTTGANRDALYGLLERDLLSKLIGHFAAKDVLSGPREGSSSWSRPRQAIADFIADRVASPEAAERLATLPWRVWAARDGFDEGFGLGAGVGAPAPKWIARSESEVKAKGGTVGDGDGDGDGEEWTKVFGGNEIMAPVWVKGVSKEEAEAGAAGKRNAAPPPKLKGRVRGVLVESCEAFDRALGLWDFERAGSEHPGDVSGVEEHVRLAQELVLERLREIGCEGCQCPFEEKVLSAHEIREKVKEKIQEKVKEKKAARSRDEI